MSRTLQSNGLRPLLIQVRGKNAKLHDGHVITDSRHMTNMRLLYYELDNTIVTVLFSLFSVNVIVVFIYLFS